jgi:hypothetical protein
MSGILTTTRDLSKSFSKFKQQQAKKETKEQAIMRLTKHFQSMGHDIERAHGMAKTRYTEIHGS